MRVHRVLCLLCLAASLLLLAGCQERPLEESFSKTSRVWETMPPLTYGQLYGEKLSVLPWDSGRAEATSSNFVAETELGYYVSVDKLRYIDRDNPVAWVPVCSQPDCGHSEFEYTCGAYKGFGLGGFLLRNGRIYFTSHMQYFPELSLRDGREPKGPGIFSKAYNGTDMRLEYSALPAGIGNGAFGYTCMLSPQGCFISFKQMMTDGSALSTSWFISESGTRKLAEHTYDSYPEAPMADIQYSPFQGDPVIYHSDLGTKLYGIKDGGFYEVDAERYTADGGYLSGNILRQFRTNDGYYDINLETGEEIFLAPPQLENSKATIILPNCIIETTLRSKSHPDGTPHSMVLFDGECWRAVNLPEELRSAANIQAFILRAVTSDRLLFYYYGPNGKCFYQIMLGKDELTAEQFGFI